MRPTWQHGVSAGDELEALQTDVMRFIAILGLCLVAISSLVNGAQQEQVTEEQPPQHERMAEKKPQQAPEVKLESNPPASLQVALESRVAKPPVVKESPAPEEDEPGFTLEFESGEALRSLLEAGHIQLFAFVGVDFKRYHPEGEFRQVEAPASYYQMDPATVPQHLRLRANSLYRGPVSWGVTLPANAIRDIQSAVSSRAGGSLLISADAGVRLVGEENRE